MAARGTADFTTREDASPQPARRRISASAIVAASPARTSSHVTKTEDAEWQMLRPACWVGGDGVTISWRPP
jgi:hypothetical protein